jgi:hypothetical protein
VAWRRPDNGRRRFFSPGRPVESAGTHLKLLCGEASASPHRGGRSLSGSSLTNPVGERPPPRIS